MVVGSTKDPGLEGNFYLNIYYDCEKTELNLEAYNTDDCFSVIQEEEETAQLLDKDFKKAIKMKSMALMMAEYDMAEKQKDKKAEIMLLKESKVRRQNSGAPSELLSPVKLNARKKNPYDVYYNQPDIKKEPKKSMFASSK